VRRYRGVVIAGVPFAKRRWSMGAVGPRALAMLGMATGADVGLLIVREIGRAGVTWMIGHAARASRPIG
jgi:hypothetical protein